MAEYKRGQHPRSLANLGKPKTKAGRFNFTLSAQSVEWLSRQPNKSAAIDCLIQTQTWREQMAKLPNGIYGNESYETLNDYSHLPKMVELEQQYGVTHYGFRVSHWDGRYYIKGRPFKNWKQRQEAHMKMMGI
jgi:hypothetical protein